MMEMVMVMVMGLPLPSMLDTIDPQHNVVIEFAKLEVIHDENAKVNVVLWRHQDRESHSQNFPHIKPIDT